MFRKYLIAFVIIPVTLIAQDGFIGGLNGVPGGGGSSTNPGGSSGNVQFNNSGTFGGFGNWDGARLAINNPAGAGTRLLSLLNTNVELFFVSEAGAVGMQSADAAGGIHASFYQMAPAGQYYFSDGIDYGAGLSRPAGAVIRSTDGSSGYSEHQAQDFKLVPNGVSQPVCAVGIRGTLWYTSSANGVPDKMEVCAKSTLDAYAWRAMATIP